MIKRYSLPEMERIWSPENRYESWLEDGPLMDVGEDNYGWVTIEDAREWGVLPVPWH